MKKTVQLLVLFAVSISGTAQVGIGTIAPTNTLDVNGDARVRTIAVGAATDDYVTVDATGVLTKTPKFNTFYTGDGTLTGLVGGKRTVTQNGASIKFDGTNGSVEFANGPRGTIYLRGKSNLRADMNFYSGTSALYMYLDFGAAAQMITGGTTSSMVLGTHAVTPLQFQTNNMQRAVILGNGNFGINANNPTNTLEVGGTDAIRVPEGTTAQRPASTSFGQIRYNSTIGRGEMYVNDVNGDGTQGDAGWRTF